MSSSGLIYAVIVGAWAAYLVPMWLRRQDELNEARPTERFSTAIRLLSGRAGMERRYAKDLRARSAEEGEHAADPDAATDSVDVRAFAMPPAGPRVRARVEAEPAGAEPQRREPRPETAPARQGNAAPSGQQVPKGAQAAAGSNSRTAKPGAQPKQQSQPQPQLNAMSASGSASGSGSGSGSAQVPAPRARRGQVSSAEAAARARRTKVLARRRRTTVLLFVAFTVGAVVAAVGGMAFLWAPGIPAVLLSTYIAYLRTQERKRFAFQMDRRRAEVAAQRLRERQPRRRPPADHDADEAEDGPEAATDPGLSALAADRRALVEQTDHAEWVDQQRERQRRPGHGESWDPVPVPLPTYVTAPVAPRATPDVDLSDPDTWSAARSSTAEPAGGRGAEAGGATGADVSAGDPGAAETADDCDDDASGEARPEDGSRGDARRRAASARRARERGRTPLFDQYEDGSRPRAANE